MATIMVSPCVTPNILLVSAVPHKSVLRWYPPDGYHRRIGAVSHVRGRNLREVSRQRLGQKTDEFLDQGGGEGSMRRGHRHGLRGVTLGWIDCWRERAMRYFASSRCKWPTSARHSRGRPSWNRSPRLRLRTYRCTHFNERPKAAAVCGQVNRSAVRPRWMASPINPCRTTSRVFLFVMG